MQSPIELAGPTGTLRLSPERGLGFSLPGGLHGGGKAPLWSLVLQEPSHPWQAGARIAVDAAGACRTERDERGIRLIWDEVSDGRRAFAVRVTVTAEPTEGGFALRIGIENREAQLTVRDVAFPRLCGVSVPPGGALLWPHGLGQRLTDLVRIVRDLHYPAGTATMPWLALAGERGGLYLGRHDLRRQAVRLAARGGDAGLDLSLTHAPFCAPSASWESAPVVLRGYEGSWHRAAAIYREWYEASSVRVTPPAWARDSSGWLLAVLKQQNGDVMWDYRTGIDRLCDIALERGLDTLGLFGWAHGGHDYLYPDYIPDPLMGGESALRAALARARRRGLRTVLYANGVIMDTGTELYRYRGNDMIALRENSEPYVHSIRKFHSATPVTFATACTGAPVWRRRMRDLAQQALDLGADGILYDQIGVWQPELCFSKDHRHETPSTAFTTERAGMVEEIAAAMRAQSPEFVVMTEGINDLLLGGIGYVHGWGTGFSAPGATHRMFGTEESFPELFRVTFPELPMTQRHSTPMLDRYHANYACVHGLRHEIETRYRADVAYLNEGRVPELADYGDAAYYPPDVALMQSVDAEEAARYLRDIIAFEQRYAEFLRRGRFVDTQGFEIAGEGIVAKGYASGERLAVCAWNPASEPRACRIDAPGYRLVACAEPESERAEPESPLGAQSVRLTVWER